MITRPLLAVRADEYENINFPVLATQKIDGIRALKIDGNLVTRNFKKFPNDYTRISLEEMLPDGIDGEVIIRSDDLNFNNVQSKLMSFGGTPKFLFCAFDYVTNGLDEPYIDRIKKLKQWYQNFEAKTILDLAQKIITPDEAKERLDSVKILVPIELNSVDDMLSYRDKCVELGYEGAMIRDPMGPYKCGRSTLKQGILLKLKKWEDSEAEIIELIEMQTNNNIQEEDEFGLSKRSSKKDGLENAGTLGLFKVRDLKTGIEFGVGTFRNLKKEDKQEIWDNQSNYLGKIIKYEYQELSKKGVPRIPTFVGFRSKFDMGEPKKLI